MECPFDEAFDGKPFCLKAMPIYETHSIYDKKHVFGPNGVKQGTVVKGAGHYESPLTVVNDETFIEGKWRKSISDIHSEYPFPFADNVPFPDKQFLEKFRGIMYGNRNYAIKHNQKDECVLCSQMLGNMEYTIQTDNTKFRFRDSLEHYYAKHNVWPSRMFHRFVMQY